MTQKELAIRSGVQQAEISKIERGEVVPKVSALDRLLIPLGRRLGIIEDPSRLPHNWPASPRSAGPTSEATEGCFRRPSGRGAGVRSNRVGAA